MAELTSSEPNSSTQKATTDSLRLQRRFDALVRAHSAVTWTTDASGFFVEPQLGWSHYTGQTWDQYKNQGGFEAIHPEDRLRTHDAWQAAVANRSIFMVEFRCWNLATGSWRWCSSGAVPVLGENGDVLEWVGTLVDFDSRMRQETALRESERRFRSILETVQSVGLMLDSLGRITFANDYLLGITGYLREEVIGRDYFDIFIQGTSDIRDRFHEAMATGDIFPHAQNDILTRNRERRSIAWDNTILRDGDGKVIGVASIGRDVTEETRLLAHLRSEEARLRTLVDAVPQLVWAANSDVSCCYVSKQWTEYTGQSEQAAFGAGWQEVLHPDDRPAVGLRWQKFIAGNSSYDTEYRLRRRDGMYRWFKARAAIARSETGDIVAIYGTSTDIHDQKTVQEELRRNEERLRITLAASSTGTFRWNPHTGEFLEFDENLRNLFGFTPEEPVRTTNDFIARVHSEDRDTVLAAVEKCTSGSDFEMEYRIVLPDGTMRWLYDRGRMINDEAGKPLYLVGACTDITLRKRSEEALLRSEKLAVAGSVAATLAHEINNPLEGLLNLIYLARQPHYNEGERAEMLEAAERELTRASELAKRSLRFYRGASVGKTDSLQTVLDSVLYVYGAKLSQHSLQLEKRYLLDAELDVPESELRQVFYNLVSNAIDALPRGGRLLLKISKTSSSSGQPMLRATVADTGHGIPSSDRQRLFRPFFTTKNETGTGLGLWVSREIVERHGGTIRVRTRSGHGSGTVFSVLLPLPTRHLAQAV